MQRIASLLSEEGIKVQASNRLVDHLCFSRQEWDLMLIDLDGLNGFLRSLLPAFFRKFPKMPRIGISTESSRDKYILGQSCGLELDAYYIDVPRPEALIVRFPDLAAKYLVEADNLQDVGGSSSVGPEARDLPKLGNQVAYTSLLSGTI
jgi:hypothetical protein